MSNGNIMSTVDTCGQKVLGMSGSLMNYINTGNAGTLDTFKKTPNLKSQEKEKRNISFKNILKFATLAFAFTAGLCLIFGGKKNKINTKNINESANSFFNKIKENFTKFWNDIESKTNDKEVKAVSEAESAIKADAKVAIVPEVKPDIKIEVKSDAKPEIKPEIKPGTAPEVPSEGINAIESVTEQTEKISLISKIKTRFKEKTKQKNDLVVDGNKRKFGREVRTNKTSELIKEKLLYRNAFEVDDVAKIYPLRKVCDNHNFKKVEYKRELKMDSMAQLAPKPRNKDVKKGFLIDFIKEKLYFDKILFCDESPRLTRKPAVKKAKSDKGARFIENKAKRLDIIVDEAPKIATERKRVAPFANLDIEVIRHRLFKKQDEIPFNKNDVKELVQKAQQDYKIATGEIDIGYRLSDKTLEYDEQFIWQEGDKFRIYDPESKVNLGVRYRIDDNGKPVPIMPGKRK